MWQILFLKTSRHTKWQTGPRMLDKTAAEQHAKELKEHLGWYSVKVETA